MKIYYHYIAKLFSPIKITTLFIFTLWFIPYHSWTQTLRVLDKNTHEAIAGAKVSQNDVHLTTNKNGTVNISDFDKNLPVLVEHSSYNSVSLSRQEINAINFCIRLETLTPDNMHNNQNLVVKEKRKIPKKKRNKVKQQKTKVEKKKAKLEKKKKKLEKKNTTVEKEKIIIEKDKKPISTAQTTQNTKDISTIPNILNLQEIVISANKWEQNTNEVPNKISTIKQKEIAFYNPQTAADLIGASEDVFVQKSQMGGGSPIIRGFASNRILLVVDGVRMNNSIFRSGNLQNVISLDANTIQDAEIVFGPGSVMYGSDAIGGVMDFHSFRPQFSSNGELFTSGSGMGRWSSANNEKTGHFHFNVGGKKLSSLTSFSYSKYNDLRMGSKEHEEYTRPEYVETINGMDSIMQNNDVNVQKYSGYNQVNIMQKLSFKATQNLRFDYAFHYSKTSDVPRYDRLTQYKENKLKYAEWYYGPQKWMLHSLSTTLNSNTLLFNQMKLIAAYQQYEESRHDRKLNMSKLRERTETLDIFSVNLDLDKQLCSKSNLFYGAEWTHNLVGSTAIKRELSDNTTENIASRYPNGATYSSAAVYANYKYQPSDKWTLLAGARFSHIQMTADFDTTYYKFPVQNMDLQNQSINASIGSVYQPCHNWEFHFNASTGFRAPNIDDVSKVFDSEPGNVIVPNPDLKPEYAYNGELSIVKRFADVAQINITGFYTLLKDAMVRRPFTFNGQDSIIYDGEMSQVQALTNTDEAQVYGIQAGFKTKLYRHLSFASKVNYTKGQDKNKKPLRHVAPFFGSAHIIYDNRLKIDVYANYNGEIAYKDLADSERSKPHIYAKDKDGNPYSPSWFTLNGMISWPFSQEWTITAGVENILDVRYRPYSSGIVAPGRNFIVSFRANF